MKKLNLDTLRVDTFATTPAVAGLRGTVAARENTGSPTCPESYGGTCWITCWDTCPCTDFVDCG